MTTDDIDIVAAALSGDKVAVLKDQLQRLEREILERIVIELLTRTTIEHEVADLRNEILNLQPGEGQADDPMARRDRLALKKECLELSGEIRSERRDAWKDVQHLKTEERIVEKELLTVQQRDKRLRDFT